MNVNLLNAEQDKMKCCTKKKFCAQELLLLCLSAVTFAEFPKRNAKYYVNFNSRYFKKILLYEFPIMPF